MSSSNNLPVGLLKANTELYLKIGQLLLQNNRQWMELLYRIGQQQAEKSSADVEKLLKTRNWQDWATLPSEMSWSRLQLRSENNQAVLQQILQAQTAFMTGLHKAIQEWQQQAVEALGSCQPSATTPFSDMLAQWQSAWEPVVNAAAATAKAASRNSTATLRR